MPEQNSTSTQLTQWIGAILMVAGVLIIAKLVPQVYQLLNNPTQAPMVSALMHYAGKDFFVFSSPNESAKITIDILLLPTAIFLEIIAYALIAGIAKSFIYSGVRLFNLPVDESIAKLIKRVDESLKR